MRIAIMQPYFLPYLGYFQLISAVDTFVIYDTIQYTKKGWINRNQMLRNGVATMFSLPLKKDSDFLNVVDRALADALKLSDDPWRLTATHIVFETSSRLGSFRLMDADDQRQVALGQFKFFFDVLRDQPIRTTITILHNAFLQASMNSVDMTLQSDSIVRKGDTFGGSLGESFDHGRLTANTDWLAVVEPVQKGVYGLSMIVILIVMVWPGAVDRRIRLYLIVICLGILGNALVCGGLSQPATRYGARVIWLLPLSATIATVVWLKLRKRSPQPPQPLSPSDSTGMSA